MLKSCQMHLHPASGPEPWRADNGSRFGKWIINPRDTGSSNIAKARLWFLHYPSMQILSCEKQKIRDVAAVQSFGLSGLNFGLSYWLPLWSETTSHLVSSHVTIRATNSTLFIGCCKLVIYMNSLDSGVADDTLFRVHLSPCLCLSLCSTFILPQACKMPHRSSLHTAPDGLLHI